MDVSLASISKRERERERKRAERQKERDFIRTTRISCDETRHRHKGDDYYKGGSDNHGSGYRGDISYLASADREDLS